MKIILDSNCFLEIIPKLSKHRKVFDDYINCKYQLVVTTEILFEYEEIFSQKMNSSIKENLIELIINQPNTIFTQVFYKWNLIEKDPDDNKYSDAAVAAQVDAIVTNDSHFNILKSTRFPDIKILSLVEFLNLLS